MNLLIDDVKKLYIKYFIAAFGSTFITSIYGIVDMAMVGKYHGPIGSASLAVFAPLWNIIYSFGLLAGIGGSVLFSAIKGECGDNKRKADEYFSASIIYGVILSAVAMFVIICFNKPLLMFFGANSETLILAQKYLVPIKYTIPLFVFVQLLSAFLRNDNNPALATAAVLFGGIFNVFGDYFFVFIMDMGILGAGLATAMGAFFSLALMFTHFLKKKNTLKLVLPTMFFHKVKKITVTGFSTCIIDLAMGILTILFNRQIMKYFDTDALSVYGIIVNISTIVQCCAYSVGQSSQPILSANYGANNRKRILQCLRYALYTVFAFGILWTALSLAAPNLYVNIFMTPTENVLKIAPGIIRAYSLSFLLLPLNVFSTYYFQALLKPGNSLIVSLTRGVVLSSVLIIALPLLLPPVSIWYAMLITETITAIYVVSKIVSYS